MSTEFQITVDDYIAAGLLNGEMTPKSKIIHLVIDIVLVVSGIAAFYIDQPIWASGFIGAAIGANLLPFILRRIVIPWRLKKHYGKYNKMRKPMTVSMNGDEGIKFESEDGTGLLNWKDIHHWRENNEYLLIYLAPKIYHLLPKRIAENGFLLQDLKGNLIKNIGEST